MSEERYEPTKAEFLADLLQGSASYASTMATVQRSHRFPSHIFIQIENMARIGNVPVSLIINQLLEAGLEAVENKLPDALKNEIHSIQEEQLERKFVTEQVEVKNVRKTTVKVHRNK